MLSVPQPHPVSSAATTAYDDVRARIVSGALPPGATVREEELAQRCGVSRTPVREALRRLESEFLLQRVGARRVVAGGPADDVEELFSLRVLLEGEAAARAALHANGVQLDALQTAHAAIEAAIDRPGTPDIERFVAANRALHAGIVAAAGSARLPAILARLVEQPVVQRTARLYDRAQLVRSNADHGELIAAIARHDPEWARNVMAAHIRRAYHAYVDARPAPAPPRND